MFLFLILVTFIFLKLRYMLLSLFFLFNYFLTILSPIITLFVIVHTFNISNEPDFLFNFFKGILRKT